MGLEFTNNFDLVAKQIMTEVSDKMHEGLAQQLAEAARERGMSNADAIRLDSDEPGSDIDVERVRARANEILAAD